jgi:hypothetical protein
VGVQMRCHAALGTNPGVTLGRFPLHGRLPRGAALMSSTNSWALVLERFWRAEVDAGHGRAAGGLVSSIRPAPCRSVTPEHSLTLPLEQERSLLAPAVFFNPQTSLAPAPRRASIPHQTILAAPRSPVGFLPSRHSFTSLDCCCEMLA